MESPEAPEMDSPTRPNQWLEEENHAENLGPPEVDNHTKPSQWIEQDEEEDVCSETSQSSSEGETIDDTVREDMLRLEESFAEHGMRFRLIDRIGEGEIASADILNSVFS